MQEYSKQLGQSAEVTIAAIAATLSQVCSLMAEVPPAAAANSAFDDLRATVRDIDSVETRLASQFQHLPVIKDNDNEESEDDSDADDDADADDAEGDDDSDEDDEGEDTDEEKEDEEDSQAKSATGTSAQTGLGSDSPPSQPHSSSVSIPEHSRGGDARCTAADHLPLDSLDFLDPA